MFSGPLREKDEADKCSYLLLWIREKGHDVYNTWTLTARHTMISTLNIIMQGEHESFKQFVTELKLLVKSCDCPHNDEMVRDCIVSATNSPHVREKLLSQGADLGACP